MNSVAWRWEGNCIYLHVHVGAGRYMQMNARLLPTIPLYTDNEEYPQIGFECTIHICKITLSRGLLRDHYCLQYPSQCGYFKCLICWQQLKPRGNDHPMTKLLTAAVSCMAGRIYANLVCLYSPLPWIIHNELRSIDYCIWSHNGWHLLHDKFQLPKNDHPLTWL